jgi:formylglycine-generating enzyme required for sulfatase activity
LRFDGIEKRRDFCMKKRLFLRFGVAVFVALLLVNCSDGGGGDGGGTPGSQPPAGQPEAATKSITSVSLIIIAPMKGATPGTTASTSGSVNFTIGTVSWSPADNPFLGDKVYTAEVTITANSGYTFNGLDSKTINGQTARVSNNTGSVVTLSYIFPKTDTKTVSSIAIKTQPIKLTYTHGNTLDLTGLVVTLTHDDTTTEDVTAASFAGKNITANPSAGNDVVYSAHNGNPVKITYGSLTCNTANLIVNKANPTAADYDISGTGTFTYNGSARTVTATAKSGKSTGAVTVKYNGSMTTPSAAGTYTVTFDVASAVDWNAATGLNAGTLVINNATPVAADYDISGTGTFTANGSAKTVTATAKSGKSTGAVTVKYNGSTTAPSVAGTYTVTFDVALAINWNAATGLSAGTLIINAPLVEMVYVPGGSFQMGEPDTSILLSNDDERPVHTVTLTGFYMGKYEVTQAQYRVVMGKSIEDQYYYVWDRGGIGDNYPMYYVVWYDALVFCNKLSIMEGLTPAYSISGKTNPSDWGTVPLFKGNTEPWDAVEIVIGADGYRLPTEAQWEYAARGGNGSPGNYKYSGSNTLDEVAWYAGNSGLKTHEVGKKKPNGLGIYDMSGNVLEWCWDWAGNYSSGAQTNPMGPFMRNWRLKRGGYYLSGSNFSGSDEDMRSVFRWNYQTFQNNYDDNGFIGFRVVRP